MLRIQSAAIAATGLIAATLTYLLLARVAPPYTVDGVPTDKIYHLIAFAALSFPLSATSRVSWKVLFALAATYGVAIEFIQPAFDRSFEHADILADVLGALTGIGAGQALQKSFPEMLRPKST